MTTKQRILETYNDRIREHGKRLSALHRRLPLGQPTGDVVQELVGSRNRHVRASQRFVSLSRAPLRSGEWRKRKQALEEALARCEAGMTQLERGLPEPVA